MTYWKDSLLIGVSNIDDQHKKLIQSADALLEACSKGQGRSRIGETLDFVITYTKEHFHDEEMLQAKYKYPQMAAHKQLHGGFIQKINALADSFNKNGPTVALTSEINKTLLHWLIAHISTEDKKLGEYIKSHQDSPSIVIA